MLWGLEGRRAILMEGMMRLFYAMIWVPPLSLLHVRTPEDVWDYQWKSVSTVRIFHMAD